MIDVRGKEKNLERYMVERTECGKKVGGYIILKDGKMVGKIIYCITRSYKRMVNLWDWTDPNVLKEVYYGEDDYTLNDALRGIPFGDMVLPGPSHNDFADNLRDKGYDVIYVM